VIFLGVVVVVVCLVVEKFFGSSGGGGVSPVLKAHRVGQKPSQ
jgi:hypothetical protein